jgi:Domain of unknown function (DUF4333)
MTACEHVSSSSAGAQAGGRAPAGAARALGFAVAALAAGSLAGCGAAATALNSVRVERAIADSILRERGLFATVTCPADVPQQAGRTFTCRARLDVGTYPLAVTETNGSGHVRYEDRRPLVILDTAKVQRAIRASILHQRHLRSTARCPREVLQQAGLSFSCSAMVKGRSYPISVRELDSAGHVQYVAE